MYSNYPRRVSSKPQKNNELFGSLRDLIGLISAGTGIFVALLYLAGRSFADGYFSAMNIPNYQVSFSIWDYSEVGWGPLVIYSTIGLLVSGLIWGGFYTILGIISKATNLHLPKWKTNNIYPTAVRWFIVALVSLVILLSANLVGITLQMVRKVGINIGQNQVLESSPQVDLVSVNELPSDNAVVITSRVGGQQIQYYEYNDFHMLTFNNGKYYLFKDIDKATCKPKQVFVINDNTNLQVRLLPPVSLAGQCPKNQVSQTGTPTKAISISTP